MQKTTSLWIPFVIVIKPTVLAPIIVRAKCVCEGALGDGHHTAH